MSVLCTFNLDRVSTGLILSSERSQNKQNIMVTKEGEISNIISNYFTEITWQIYLKQDVIKPLRTSNIAAFKNSESIQTIKLSNFLCNRKFLVLKCY